MILNSPTSNCNAFIITLDKKEIGKNNEGNGKGLVIKIKGLKGDSSDKAPGTSVLIEYYEGKVQLHVWTNNKQDPQTIILT